MGIAAENVARQFQITRDDQDQFALASQNKAEAAQKAGKFTDEIVAVTLKGKKGDTVVDQDEYIRHGATIDAMTVVTFETIDAAVDVTTLWTPPMSADSLL